MVYLFWSGFRINKICTVNDVGVTGYSFIVFCIGPSVSLGLSIVPVFQLPPSSLRVAPLETGYFPADDTKTSGNGHRQET